MCNFSSTKHTGQTLPFDVCIASLNVGEGLAGKGNGSPTLDESHTKAILTSIGLHYDGL